MGSFVKKGVFITFPYYARYVQGEISQGHVLEDCMLLDMLLANRLIGRQSTPVWTKKAKKCKKNGSSGVFVGKGSNPLISLLSRNYFHL